jgi:formate-dependent nitrite reductase membrane component NrfD
MQACPYDALYIDPDNNTAAKCNYCAHRVEVGRAPACVDVCPEHAIIAGDMDNPHTEIATLLSREQVIVRKPEKGTIPNLFYIDGDYQSLDPDETDKSGPGLWNSQARGVGHYAKAAEKMVNTNDDVNLLQMSIDNELQAAYQKKETENPNYIDVLNGKARRVYDTPDKGILWGWEVSAYVVTKAIAAGAFMVPFIAMLMGYELNETVKLFSVGTSLVFLALTGLFLVMDLDRPDRFLNVLLRPQWNSWLVKGGYTISVFGLLMTIWGAATLLGWDIPEGAFLWVTAFFAVILAVYTAFLFAQAKGRDFWQSPTLPLHMLVHSLLAGGAVFAIVSLILDFSGWDDLVRNILLGGILVNVLTLISELTITHPTKAAKKVVHMILKEQYKNTFWLGTVLLGNLVPLVLIRVTDSPLALGLAGVLILVGMYITEKIWVEAPQRIPLA